MLYWNVSTQNLSFSGEIKGGGTGIAMKDAAGDKFISCNPVLRQSPYPRQNQGKRSIKQRKIRKFFLS